MVGAVVSDSYGTYQLPVADSFQKLAYQIRQFPPLSTRTIPKEEPRPIKSTKPVAGTSIHFKELIIGRCWQYQMKIGLKDSEKINCEKVWDAFKESFAFKGPCDVTTKDYLIFLDKIEEDIPKNKVMMELKSS